MSQPQFSRLSISQSQHSRPFIAPQPMQRPPNTQTNPKCVETQRHNAEKNTKHQLNNPYEYYDTNEINNECYHNDSVHYGNQNYKDTAHYYNKNYND